MPRAALFRWLGGGLLVIGMVLALRTAWLLLVHFNGMSDLSRSRAYTVLPIAVGMIGLGTWLALRDRAGH